MNLQAKFLCSFSIIILLPFITFAVLTQHNSEEIVRKHLTEEALDQVTQFCYLYDRELFSMESFMNQITSNRNVFDTFNELYNTNADEESLSNEQKENFNYELMYITYTKYDKLNGIYYFNESSCFNLFLKVPTNKLNAGVFSEHWFKKINSKNDGSISTNVSLRGYSNNEKRLVISRAKNIINAATYTKEGVLLVDYDYDSFLKSVLEQVKDLEYIGKNFYVLDQDNYVMYSSNTAMLLKKLNYTVNWDNLKLNLDDGESYSVSYTSPYTGWKFITFIPVNKFSGDIKSNRLSIFLLTFTLFILVLLFSFLVSSKILKPINMLTGFMAKVKSGDFSARIVIKSKDETKLLADSFNEMTSNLEKMIDKVYIAEIRQREAELLSLQSQINPHFLYNTLDSIRGSAVEHGVSEISEMTRCLAFMLRYSVNKDMLVIVRDEISHIQNYISIQNFRFNNKFELILNVPEDIMNCSILRLTLQPFVENSIIHGFKDKPGKGRIEISISEINSDIMISIRDNGAGIAHNQILDLNNMLSGEIDRLGAESNSKTTGIGIKNVNQRIKLYFGPRYGVRYLEPEMGSLIEIIIPCTNEEE